MSRHAASIIRFTEVLKLVANNLTGSHVGMTPLLLQETKNARALSEGTVLCSEERVPIGRIEDTFGPVMCPLYALRWAGQGEMPSSLAVGSPVFTTQKLAEYLLAEQLYTNVSAHDLFLQSILAHWAPSFSFNADQCCIVSKQQ